MRHFHDDSFYFRFVSHRINLCEKHADIVENFFNRMNFDIVQEKGLENVQKRRDRIYVGGDVCIWILRVHNNVG